jgi:predicted alpha/beta superfamily hydrolase
MLKNIIGGCLLLIVVSCDNVEVKKNAAQTEVPPSSVKLFSKEIKDTFYISVTLPENMDAERTKRYPVIYLLDANLHYDIMSATFKHYSEVNLLPQAILVGIGYKNIFDLDSLRNRDLTFPRAMAEYEMPISGGAHKFRDFIQTELFRYVEANYPADPAKRVLMGHSLSGYFTLFTMHEDLRNNNNAFAAYIAASPALHYNNYYLLKEFDRSKMQNKTAPKVFVTYGGLEDVQEGEDQLKREMILQQLTELFSERNKILYKGEIYSNIGHMNMAFPSFVKGLQWTFDMVEE